MRTVAIMQARMGSTRLPNKVFLKLEGKTVLERVIERVKQAKTVDEVMVATTISKADLVILKKCAELGVRVFCGSENDVLDRYYQAARLVEADNIVRITSDCPVMDPKIIDQVVNLHKRKKADYTSNSAVETFPDGEDVEVFTFKALKTAWEKADLLSEREHVTPYIRNNKGKFKLAGLQFRLNLSSLRWTLDRSQDYKFLKILYAKLYKQNKMFGIEEIIKFLEKNPRIQEINMHIVRNEGYIKSLREDKRVKK